MDGGRPERSRPCSSWPVWAAGPGTGGDCRGERVGSAGVVGVCRRIPSLNHMYAVVSFVVDWFTLGLLAYFLFINSLYLWFSGFAYVALLKHRRKWTARELGAVMRSAATPGVSILVPAHNEEAGIVSTVRSLQTLNYPQFEVIVISDGSSDATLHRLKEAYGLLRAPGSYEPRLRTAAVRGICPRHRPKPRHSRGWAAPSRRARLSSWPILAPAPPGSGRRRARPRRRGRRTIPHSGFPGFPHSRGRSRGEHTCFAPVTSCWDPGSAAARSG